MSDERPNVLVIVLDCARSDRCLGPDRSARTPVMDRIRREGVSLPVTIAEQSATTPAMASLLTGTYSFRHGIWAVGGYRLLDDVPSVAEVLSDHGYHTYAEMTGPLVPVCGLDRGFERYRFRPVGDYMHTSWGQRFADELAHGAFREPWMIFLHLWELHLPRQVTPEFDEDQFGRTVYDRAVSSVDHQLGRILEKVGDNTLTVITGDHGEKTETETYRPDTAVDYVTRLYDTGRCRGGVTFGLCHALVGGVTMQQLRGHLQPMLESFSQRQTPRDISVGAISTLRDLMSVIRFSPWLRPRDLLSVLTPAKFIHSMESRGLVDPDRSRRWVERQVNRKGLDRLFGMYLRMWISAYRRQCRQGHLIHVYDYLTRVPLVMHWPGRLAAGTTSERLVRQVDVPATVLELLGIDSPPGFSEDGQSLVPLIRGQSWQGRPAFLSVAGQPRDAELRGLRTERYRYTWGWQNPEMPVELYDLRSDANETANLAESNPEVCRELASLADGMVPPGGPRVGRLGALTAAQHATLEQRLHELGYLD